MPGKVVHFEIPADNVERAKVFYEKAFGWQINKYPGMEYHGVGTTHVDQKTQMPREPGAINGGMTKRPAAPASPHKHTIRQFQFSTASPDRVCTHTTVYFWPAYMNK